MFLRLCLCLCLCLSPSFPLPLSIAENGANQRGKGLNFNLQDEVEVLDHDGFGLLTLLGILHSALDQCNRCNKGTRVHRWPTRPRFRCAQHLFERLCLSIHPFVRPSISPYSAHYKINTGAHRWPTLASSFLVMMFWYVQFLLNQL